jgi:hypothetical protein
MWVYRSVLYIKPGLMAEAIANLKGNPLPEGIRVRLLRPINGAEAANQLVQELEFEDIDAVAADYGRPGPLDERVMRLVELNQNRGHRELYQVVHDVPGVGSPGAWVHRRTRWMKPGVRNEWVALMRSTVSWSYAGYSWRVMYPRTGAEIGDILIDEVTFSSLPEHDAAILERFSNAEFLKFAEFERRQSDVDLYRMVE